MSPAHPRAVHHRTCHLCEANCGLIIEVEGRRILSIKGDPDNALSRGHICPKAIALQDLQDDPDRLRRPLKRGAEGGWEDISWDQALREIGERTRQILAHDPASATMYRGNPATHHYANALNLRHLKSALKARNVFSASTVDHIPHLVANHALFGHAALFAIPDIDRTKTMIVMGGNPMASNGSIWTVPDFRNRVRALQARGGQLVTIDPRRTETAKIADRHLFIRPATDPWFLVALLKALFAHTARPALPDYIGGLQGVQDVLAAFSADVCAENCGVAPEDIAWIADQMLAGPAIFYGRMGISVQEHGTLNAWLITVINIVAGQLDREGGLVFPSPAADEIVTGGQGAFGRWHSRVKGYPEIMGEIPVATLADEIETPGAGQIRAMFLLAGNPVLSVPNGSRLEKALGQLDLLVSIDIYLNETSRLAHYILPPAGPLERDHYGLMMLPLAVRNFAMYSPALFEPDADSKLDWEIVRELAAAITGEPVQAPLPRDQLDQLLRSGEYGISIEDLLRQPSGMDFGPPKVGRLPQRLFTPDKSIDCAPERFCRELIKLAAHREAVPGEYLLIGRRHLRSNNSWLGNSARLVKGPPRCTLMIHPDDAAKLGKNEGDTIEAISRVGAIRLPVEITEDIMPGVVSVPHGWGHSREGVAMRVAKTIRGASANDLTDDAVIDVLSGNAKFSGVPVRLA